MSKARLLNGAPAKHASVRLKFSSNQIFQDLNATGNEVTLPETLENSNTPQRNPSHQNKEDQTDMPKTQRKSSAFAIPGFDANKYGKPAKFDPQEDSPTKEIVPRIGNEGPEVVRDVPIEGTHPRKLLNLFNNQPTTKESSSHIQIESEAACKAGGTQLATDGRLDKSMTSESEVDELVNPNFRRPRRQDRRRTGNRVVAIDERKVLQSMNASQNGARKPSRGSDQARCRNSLEAKNGIGPTSAAQLDNLQAARIGDIRRSRQVRAADQTTSLSDLYKARQTVTRGRGEHNRIVHGNGHEGKSVIAANSIAGSENRDDALPLKAQTSSQVSQKASEVTELARASGVFKEELAINEKPTKPADRVRADDRGHSNGRRGGRARADGAGKNSRWISNRDIKPIYANIDKDSNAWGSDVPSDGEAMSEDSTKAMRHGKLFGRNAPAEPEASLSLPWDATKFSPAPLDWDRRPQFNNNSVEFRKGFDHWKDLAAGFAVRPETGQPFQIIETARVEQIELHADGIDLVPLKHTVNRQNAAIYGYVQRDLNDFIHMSQPLHDWDFGDWGKVDMRLQKNRDHNEETVKILNANWLAHRNLRPQSEQLEKDDPNTTGLERYKRSIAQTPATNPNTPKANMYVRPAKEQDLVQISEIYNWYIVNTARTAELCKIDGNEMHNRMLDAEAAKLPFIVAVTRSAKQSRGNVKPGKNRNGHTGETIIGFAQAADFTNMQMAERFTVEIELYVHHDWLRNGVGNCLLDRLLTSLDRGHVVRGGYDFVCDATERHRYDGGGIRDLHLLMFVIRHFKAPNPRDPEGGEHDFEKWTKKWLMDKWDFEQQGLFIKNGAKFGRFLNTAFLARETLWQPADGRLPDPASAV